MRKRLAITGLIAAIVVGAAASAPAQTGPPRLLGLRVSNGGTPFAGDTPWLTTVSPNGDGFRDRALFRFKLDRAATVEVRVVATDEVRRPVQTIWSTRRRLSRRARTRSPGSPRGSTPDRSYLVRFVVTGRNGGRRVYGYEPPRRNRLTSGARRPRAGNRGRLPGTLLPGRRHGDRRHLDRRQAREAAALLVREPAEADRARPAHAAASRSRRPCSSSGRPAAARRTTSRSAPRASSRAASTSCA